MLSAVLKVAVLAVSLALDVFAVSVGVGVRGHTRAEKIRIGAAFGSAEVVMNIVGAGIGRGIGQLIGAAAAYLGFAALVGVGIYMIVESLREESGDLDLSTGWGLFIAAMSISLDSLGVGFTLPYLGVNVVVALIAVFVVSIIATTTGLWLGRIVGNRVGGATGLIAGILLTLTGSVFAILHARGF
ncbi:MAG: manganese efflux pump [Vulcanimicrobiaceae bacterium]|jgi:putative Mn2+ efflux pump MntP